MKHTMNFTRNMNEVAHIMMDKLEVGIAKVLIEIVEITCNQVIHHDNPMTFGKKAIYKVRPDKTSSTSDKNTQVDKSFALIINCGAKSTTGNQAFLSASIACAASGNRHQEHKDIHQIINKYTVIYQPMYNQRRHTAHRSDNENAPDHIIG